MTTSGADRNLYKILGLPPPQSRATGVPSKHDIKSAYHRALLVHHPDKISNIVSSTDKDDSTSKQDTGYLIDEIKLAYQTLSDPALRSAYDEQNFNNGKFNQFGQQSNDVSGTHPGVESLDLDDMVYDDRRHVWRRPCRCGNDEGYIVTEAELDGESSSGEIYVGCQGCSLYIKVLFAGEEEPSSV